MVISLPPRSSRRVLLVVAIAAATSVVILYRSVHYQSILSVDYFRQPRTLYDRIARHAGVYSDKSRINHYRGSHGAQASTLEKTILYTSSNWAFTDFTINFLCKARQVTEYDMVVIAQDRLAHDFFTSLGIETLDSSDFGLPDAASESTAWGDPAYDALIRARLVMLLQILEMGFNAFFSDVDIAWNGDPVMGLLEGVDFEYQADWSSVPNYIDHDGVHGCMGFFFIRSNHKTIKFISDVIKTFETAPLTNDQKMTFDVVDNMKLQDEARYVVKPFNDSVPASDSGSNQLLLTSFPPLLYSPGLDWALNPGGFQQAWVASGLELPARPIAAHANWMIGDVKKKQTLKDHGMWVINDELLAVAQSDYKESWSEPIEVSQGWWARPPAISTWQSFCGTEDMDEQ